MMDSSRGKFYVQENYNIFSIKYNINDIFQVFSIQDSIEFRSIV